MPIRRLEDTLTATTATIAGEDIAASSIPVKPHIQPGVLQPAVAGKLLDGSTSHSGAYGTAQSDGHSYYYTDIKGSKPIKDPRIGAHFGGQRHKARSIQLLEQETATHGQNVYSIDGREWMRIVDSTNGNVTVNNQSAGNYLYLNNITVFIEFTAYFSSFNFIHQTEANRKYRYSIDGATEVGTDYGNSTANSPLGSRYVDAGSLVNVPVNATLGIHTIKLRVNQADNTFNGIELIAQDTTSTATKSKIQIPAQNVVSYGKKFAVGAAAHHYNPFAIKGDGTTASTIPNNTTGDSVATGWAGSTSAYWEPTLDTATSLGLAAWVEGGAYYRPVNGGRIVKWIDSTGAIKTSVNMMPPSAKAVGSHSGDATPTGATNWSTQVLPIFSSGVVDSTQAEVAKTFHVREFGNGAANGGTGATYADVSMMSGSDDIAYVMDDGLTSISGDDVEGHTDRISGIRFNNPNKSFYITFIGTGISVLRNEANSQSSNDQYSYTVDGVTLTTYNSTNTAHPQYVNVAQNLPYGTHILKISLGTVSNYGIYWKEFNFHQPKMPPIPEDAVIIADYMLMADYVSIPNGTAGDKGKITKGVRRISASRDHFYNSGATITFDGPSPGNTEVPADGFRVYNNNASTVYQLPYFGTGSVFRTGVASDRSAAAQFKINGTLVTTSSSGTNHSGTQVLNSWTTGSGSFQTDNDGSFTTYNSGSAQGWASVSGITLGQNTVAVNNTTTSYLTFNGYDVASPIHSSSHYQTFETPFLHELVGGDRNMEQNNLVVTPDGKSWDEVTRDTSYIGNHAMRVTTDTNHNGLDVVIFDEYRGNYNGRDYFTKDFCPAYDRHICLRNGWYQMSMFCYDDGAEHLRIYVNNAYVATSYSTGSGIQNNLAMSYSHYFKRGDYFYVKGAYGNDGIPYANFEIIRID